MQIEQRRLVDLKDAQHNSRTHSPEQIAQIAASMQEFGWTNPILIDERDEIIAGHGRKAAALQRGDVFGPCVVLAGLSDTQKRAYLIADNQLPLNAGWNLDSLRSEIEALHELDFNIDVLGFDASFLDDLLAEALPTSANDDSVPETPESPTTRLGDVWLLGDHRLMCGDSTSIDAVERLLAGQAPNTMITDPPYGVKYEAAWRADAKRVKKTAREQSSNLCNDDRSDWYDAYVLFPGSVAYVWHASAFTDVVMEGLKRSGFEIKQQIIWNKNVHALSRSDYHWKHEPCWYAVKKGGDRNWKGGRTQTTVWDIKSVMFEEGKTAHPTQKPVEIYTRAIEHHTNPGEYIYEPFGGSGTSIIAAEKLNRRSLTMELDPKYCDVIIKRWQNYTGKTAVHAETGRLFDAFPA